LFGAGASKNAIPVVNGIRPRIRQLVDYIKREYASSLKEDGNFADLSEEQKDQDPIVEFIITDLE